LNPIRAILAALPKPRRAEFHDTLIPGRSAQILSHPMTKQELHKLFLEATFHGRLIGWTIVRCKHDTNAELRLLRKSALAGIYDYLTEGKQWPTLATVLIFNPAALVLLDRACQAARRKAGL